MRTELQTLDTTAVMYRGEFSKKQISDIVSSGRPYDILGHIVIPPFSYESNVLGIDLPPSFFDDSIPGRGPIDQIGFTYNNLRVDWAWVPYETLNPNLDGEYEFAARLAEEHLTVLGGLFPDGNREAVREFILKSMGNLLVKLASGTLATLQLPEEIKRIENEYQRFLNSPPEPPVISLN